ncbi:MAG: hypothetical protein ACXV4Z_06810 [Halobacteriota archaeon]
MSRVWFVVAALWGAFLATIVYFGMVTAPIWLILAWWIIPMMFIGTFISFTICERKGWT